MEEKRSEPKYVTHEQFARERAAARLRRNPPPTRDPETLELRSDPPPPPLDPQEAARDQKARLYDRLSSSRSRAPLEVQLFNRAMDESRENMLTVVAVISLFVPFGPLLALWPLFGSSGRAGAIAVFSIWIGIIAGLLFYRSVYAYVWVFFF